MTRKKWINQLNHVNLLEIHKAFAKGKVLQYVRAPCKTVDECTDFRSHMRNFLRVFKITPVLYQAQQERVAAGMA